MTKRQATRLVVLFGLVSLFADMTYESARAMTGPLLSSLGATAATVGIAAGFGEFVAYGLRLVSGWLADRTGSYWALTFAGYAINVLAVPALAFAGRWEIVVVLVVMERAAKALRGPARDTLLAHAGAPVGSGWAFGVHELLDQVGSIGGVLLMALIVARSSMRTGFLFLTIPAVLSLVMLAIARSYAPSQLLASQQNGGTARFMPNFRTALIATGLMGAGIADFAMISFHAKTHGLLPEAAIVLAYAVAQASNAVSAPGLGRVFDRIGPRTLGIGAVLGATASVLAFSFSATLFVVGVVLWGIALGCHGSVLKATVSAYTGSERKAWAFGVFHSVYGLLCFVGSAGVGLLYERSIPAAILFSVTLQLLALPVIARLPLTRSPRPAGA